MNDLLLAGLAREALKTALWVAGPALLVSLVVGLAVSVFQVVTSLQDQTIAFVPKMVAVMEQWREQGRVPASILASKVQDGSATRTRPLCPYPQVARYKGAGSIDRAENFACAMP